MLVSPYCVVPLGWIATRCAYCAYVGRGYTKLVFDMHMYVICMHDGHFHCNTFIRSIHLYHHDIIMRHHEHGDQSFVPDLQPFNNSRFIHQIHLKENIYW